MHDYVELAQAETAAYASFSRSARACAEVIRKGSDLQSKSDTGVAHEPEVGAILEPAVVLDANVCYDPGGRTILPDSSL